MAKERKFNPVQAQRKADKAKEIKKGKAEQQARRNEKLSQRNPDRVQKQIDDLKAIKDGGGTLTKLEEQSLEALEKDLKAIKKAREALGDRAPTFGRGGGGESRDGSAVLGKRRRDDFSSSDSDVPDDVRRIPMPRDTPPPIPKEAMDAWWAKRRARRATTNANAEPVQGNRRLGVQQSADGIGASADAELPPRVAPPTVEAKAVYESKPVLRNLRKEAVSAFIPNVVKVKLDKGKGQAGLLEPEEADQLEREGYLRTSDTGLTHQTLAAADDGPDSSFRHRRVTIEDHHEE